MNRIELGAVAVARLVEWTGPVLTVDAFFPDVDHQTWVDNQSWLAPDFWRPSDNAYPVALQSWLLRSDGQNVLITLAAATASPARPTPPSITSTLGTSGSWPPPA